MLHLQTYQKTKSASRSSVSENSASEQKGPLRRPAVGADLLVNKSISQRNESNKQGNPVMSIQYWPRSLRLVRDYQGLNKKTTPPLRTEIQSFSLKSKRRLKFNAGNAFPALISQFGLTYHKTSPDGKTVKEHMNTFLTALRRKYPEVKYLWILEFQTRGIPHFHLYLSLPVETKGLHSFLAETWNRITEPENKTHLKFHKHKTNFIAWEMGSASYLCKYLDKEHQKAVPEGFTGVGRFWGNSRSLVPEPIEIDMEEFSQCYDLEEIDIETGEIVEFKATEYVVRQLCKHHEKSLRGSRWKSSARKRPTSYLLPVGSTIFRQLENYLYKQKRNSNDVPF